MLNPWHNCCPYPGVSSPHLHAAPRTMHHVTHAVPTTHPTWHPQSLGLVIAESSPQLRHYTL